jgi:hypothetical protein
MGKRGMGSWVFAFALVCLAGNALSAGTCMRFLRISSLPRIAGMGEATVAVTDATWAETNPAHLTNIDGSLITFSHTSWFQDIALETLTLGTAGGSNGFGLSIVGLHTDPLEGYDAFDVPQGTFRFYDLLVSATYARKVHPTLSMGATGKIVYEKIDWDSATGFALDLGLGYTAPRRLLGGQVSLGLAVRDLGPRMGYFDEKFDLPLAAQAGVSYKPMGLPEDLDAVVALDYAKTRDQDGGLLAGVEVGFRRMVALRFGYRGTYENGDLAFGLGLGLANTLVDYAYMDMGDDLGGTHRVSVAFKVGAIFPSPESSR